jgi:hypothetical protein
VGELKIRGEFSTDFANANPVHVNNDQFPTQVGGKLKQRKLVEF